MSVVTETSAHQARPSVQTSSGTVPAAAPHSKVSTS